MLKPTKVRLKFSGIERKRSVRIMTKKGSFLLCKIQPFEAIKNDKKINLDNFF